MEWPGGMLTHFTRVYVGNVYEKGVVVITASPWMITMDPQNEEVENEEPKNVAGHESYDGFSQARTNRTGGSALTPTRGGSA